jgi:hypothetical protein
MVLLASSYDESKYFKAVDLSDDRKVRIKSVTAEAVGTGADKQQKLVVWFTNDKRGLVLNRTNNRVLRGAFGDDTSGWAGKIIVIFSMTVEMHGKPTIGLRVRIPPPKHSGEATVASKPKPSGNGHSAAVTQPPDDDLDDQSPAKTSLADEMDDEINF